LNNGSVILYQQVAVLSGLPVELYFFTWRHESQFNDIPCWFCQRYVSSKESCVRKIPVHISASHRLSLVYILLSCFGVIAITTAVMAAFNQNYLGAIGTIAFISSSSPKERWLLIIRLLLSCMGTKFCK
jgi:hypothetical protein